MKRHHPILFAIFVLALAALACNAVTGGGESDPTGPTSTPSPRVILSDDFSSSRWGTGTDANSSVEYTNEALQMIVYTTNYFVWSTPNDQDYQNIHVEVTVLNNGTDSATGFGIMCNQQAVSNDFYYFAVRPDGNYAIAKAVDGQNDLFLTNNDQWGTSDLIPVDAPSYNVGADCGNGTLTLYVNKQQIASVADASYVSGGVALFTSSSAEAINTDVSFDDFRMTELP